MLAHSKYENNRDFFVVVCMPDQQLHMFLCPKLLDISVWDFKLCFSIPTSLCNAAVTLLIVLSSFLTHYAMQLMSHHALPVW